jgi:hypothetical protein
MTDALAAQQREVTLRFLADQMLGKLAKYLRFLGYDTFYTNKQISDKELIEIAKKEERVILTRDKIIAQNVPNSVYLKNDNLEEQFRELNKNIYITKIAILSRCSLCNSVLEKVNKEMVKKFVPEYIYVHNNDFYICNTCKKVYWYGSHTQRIIKEIDNLLKEVKK